MTRKPHTLTVKETLAHLNVNPNHGLSTIEVNERSKLHGKNRLRSQKAKKWWILLLHQFLDPIIYILATATLLAFLFAEWMEGFTVLVVILITVLIGFIMEFQAIRSVEQLQKIVQTQITVIRNGKQTRLGIQHLVPGDIIKLTSGDVVPADARLLWHQSLAVKESVLTGESDQVEKDIIVLSEKTSLAERTNMVYKGTTVSRGNAKAVVTTIGDNTQLGEISQLTQEATQQKTPLEKKLNSLSHKLILLTLLLALLIVISGFFQGKDIVLMIKTGIALAVAAIPEGLPIVATIALAKGMVKLSRQNVIIKKLESVQTLGETTIVCTDKTGTLTEDKMAVRSLLLHDAVVDVHEFYLSNDLKNLIKTLAYDKIIEVGLLCNNAIIYEDHGQGDAMEIALLEFGIQLGYDFIKIRTQNIEIAEIPFDAIEKMMSTLTKKKEQYQVNVKGAPEKVLAACETVLTDHGVQTLLNNQEWLTKANMLAARGLRVLAFAYKESGSQPTTDELITGLTFLGLIGFIDPPRSDVKQAIQTYKNAGIKIVMLTGDHPATAAKVAEEIGLLSKDEVSSSVIHGKDISTLHNLKSATEHKILNAKIFARMIPKQKLELINFYQKHNAVVGMIGDGVNDAPALKKADIGIAMGIRGSEAAKEVADVILMNDQFTSIKLAIQQGRTIFGNIRYFVVYLLSCNLAEIISVAIASLTNLPLPLLPLQILFLNLITDIFPALALGMGKGDPKIMRLPPRNPEEPILTKKHWRSIVTYGIAITTSVIGITIYAYFVLNLNAIIVNNMAFHTLVVAQLLNVFNIPHSGKPFFKNEVITNSWIWAAIFLSSLLIGVAYVVPIFKQVFSLVFLTPEQFMIVGLFGAGSLILIQLFKRLER
ncbi:cation-translocating P-type ATPase [Aquimarina sp. 2-A2]|uniref:cation-translocating P-type ATPase n=1 Tax=Aquimarina sp. 2-A2 TaxID=3382644 RepID=UPI00387F180B